VYASVSAIYGRNRFHYTYHTKRTIVGKILSLINYSIVGTYNNRRSLKLWQIFGIKHRLWKLYCMRKKNCILSLFNDAAKRLIYLAQN
jgi:hypothetical protein